MFKRKTTLSIIFSALTLGLISTGFINNNDKVVEAKAKEEKIEYIYLDCSKPVSDGYSFFHPYVIFGGGANVSDYMMKSVKDNVYKYPIPQGATLVNFEDHYTIDGRVKSELWYDGHNWSIDIPETKRTFYINKYDSYGSITEVDAFFGEWRDNYDMPDEEGYYLVNSDNDYKYADSIKMDEGKHGDLAEAIKINAKSNQYLKVRSWFNNTNTTYPSSGKGYKPDKDKDVNVYISESNEFLVEDYVIPPEEDGYYVFGSILSETVDEYKSEYKTTSFVDESYDYIEVYDNLALGLNDVISIRQHSSSSHPRDKYIAPVSYLSETYFEINGNNVRIKYEYKDVMHYDIFIVQTDDGTYFLPKFHEDKCVNKITAVFFDVNGVKTGKQALPDQLSYGYFTPATPDVDGKYCLGKAYTDEDCTVEYSRHYVDSPENIYIKYYNSGYYLLPRIVKSEGATTTYKTVYEVGTKMDTTNLEEGSLAEVTIRPMPEGEGPYDFAYLYYDEDGKMTFYQYHTISDDYARSEWFSDHYSVEVHYGNRGKYFRAFIKYDKDSKENRVFLKDAGSGFCSDFMSKIGDICDSSGVNTNIEDLQTEWANQIEAYSNVEYKQEIVKLGFNYFESPENIYESMMNKYYYIISKYGSDKFINFIFPDMDPILPNELDNNVFIKYNDAAIYTAVISISVTGISLFVTLLVFKKKKKIK